MHSWTQPEFRRGMRLVDETNPFDLHLIAFEPVLRTQASVRLLQQYEKLVEHAGIIGYGGSLTPTLHSDSYSSQLLPANGAGPWLELDLIGDDCDLHYRNEGV